MWDSVKTDGRWIITATVEAAKNTNLLLQYGTGTGSEDLVVFIKEGFRTNELNMYAAKTEWDKFMAAAQAVSYWFKQPEYSRGGLYTIGCSGLERAIVIGVTTTLLNDASIDPSDALGMFNAGNRHTGKGCGIERDIYGHAIQAVHMRAFSWESSKIIRNRYIELNSTPTEAHTMEQGETQEDDMFGSDEDHNDKENSGNDNNLNPRGVTREQGQRSNLINTSGLNDVVRNFVA